MIKFQYYTGGITSVIPKGIITLDDFLYKIFNPKDENALLLEEIKRASLAGNKKLKAELKLKLLYFTPALIIKEGCPRRYDNIESFTGLAQIDFDGFDNEDQAEDCKHWLFEHKEIVCAYLSPSRLGVKGLVKIPISESVDEFQDYYRAITQKYKVDYNIPHFDIAPQNAVLPLFYSSDRDVLIREDAVVWDKKKAKKEYIPNEAKTITYDSNSPLSKKLISKFIDRVDRISDNGHPQLRRACLMLGSLVGGGFLSEHEAVSLADQAIRNNAYLSNAHPHSLYLTTARWCIKEGIKRPYFL